MPVARVHRLCALSISVSELQEDRKFLTNIHRGTSDRVSALSRDYSSHRVDNSRELMSPHLLAEFSNFIQTLLPRSRLSRIAGLTPLFFAPYCFSCSIVFCARQCRRNGERQRFGNDHGRQYRNQVSRRSRMGTFVTKERTSCSQLSRTLALGFAEHCP